MVKTEALVAKANYCVVCDDLRTEQSGKLIIIGVYTEDVVVPRFPAVLPRLTFLSRVAGPARIPRVRGTLRYVGGEAILTLEAQGEGNDELETTFAVLAAAPVVFPRAGDLEYVLTDVEHNDAPILVHRFRVQQQAVDSPR